MRSLGQAIENIIDIVLTLDSSKTKDYNRLFPTLLSLQHLQDKILPLSAILRATSTTVKNLEKMNTLLYSQGHSDERIFQKLTNELSYYQSLINEHLEGLEVLENKTNTSLNLLGVALGLKNQVTAASINDKMLDLTNDTVDDSATVKVVTVVTLIYLPSSFISSFLGMNPFSFQTADSPRFTISNQFWTFVILSVPLTVLTLTSWHIFSRRRTKQRGHARFQVGKTQLNA